jgi:transposase
MKRYTINLSDEEREKLTRLTTTGRHAARKMLHARTLLKADEGLTDVKIGEHLGVGIRTVERIRQRCATEGLSAALNPKKRPPKRPKIDGEAEARLVQLACSTAPDGLGRWTLRLLANKLVELDVVDSISHETVRRCLEKKRAKAVEDAKVLHTTGTKRRIRSGNGRRARGLSASL